MHTSLDDGTEILISLLKMIKLGSQKKFLELFLGQTTTFSKFMATFRLKKVTCKGPNLDMVKLVN